MATIAVAATAPFGADILERLAADHDIALLLTRPDKQRGRGRKLAPTPAKETAERRQLAFVHGGLTSRVGELRQQTLFASSVSKAEFQRPRWRVIRRHQLPERIADR